MRKFIVFFLGISMITVSALYDAPAPLSCATQAETIHEYPDGDVISNPFTFHDETQTTDDFILETTTVNQEETTVPVITTTFEEITTVPATTNQEDVTVSTTSSEQEISVTTTVEETSSLKGNEETSSFEDNKATSSNKSETGTNNVKGSEQGSEYDGDVIENPFGEEFTSTNSSEPQTTATPETKKQTNTIINASSLHYQFKINKGTKKAILYKSTKANRKSAVIPSQISYKGTIYNVTSIATKAFYKHKKLKSVTLGKYITKIGSNAFYGCTSLKKVTIKSKKLSTIGTNAFKKTYKKATFFVPKSKLKNYKKKLRKKGVSKKAKFKAL